jgi:hypothetical protein
MVRLHALIAAFMLLLATSAMRAGAVPAADPLTTIRAQAWTADNAPIPRARLRLRNVSDGKSGPTGIANEAGQFTFSGVAAGDYLVELVNESASVLAVSQAFTIAEGETVGTFVRLGRSRAFLTFAAGVTGAAFFGNAATAVTAVASTLGIVGVTPTARPASAGR